MRRYFGVLASVMIYPFLGICLLVAGTRGAAEDTKAVRASVQKLADAVAREDSAQVKSLVEEISKFELEAVMNLMAKRDAKKQSFGFGKTPPAEKNLDSIEAKISNMSKRAKPQPQINRESADLVDLAYRTAAIGEVAKARVPEKDEGAKKRKDWSEWSDAMVKAALELARAAKDKKPGDIKTAAARLNSSCSNCHGVFRD